MNNNIFGISIDSNDFFLFIKVHALQCIESFYQSYENLENEFYDYKGLNGNELKVATIEKIIKYFKENKVPKKIIVLDFSFINNVEKNQFSNFKTIISEIVKTQKKSLIFWECMPSIFFDIWENDFNFHMKFFSDCCEFKVKNMNDDTINNFDDNMDMIYSYIIPQGSDIKFDDLSYEYIADVYNATLNESKRNFIKSFCEGNESNKGSWTSSSVYLKKYINVKRMIESSHCNNFYLYLYELAHIIKNKYLCDRTSNRKNVKLCCVTLNGAFIGSILSSLLCIDLVTLDHLGPISHLYKADFEEMIIAKNEYILVTDVVCMGTESHVVKNVIEYLGGKYLGGVTLVRIETTDKDDHNTGVQLINLTHEDNFLDYSIETNFSCPKLIVENNNEF